MVFPSLSPTTKIALLMVPSLVCIQVCWLGDNLPRRGAGGLRSQTTQQTRMTSSNISSAVSSTCGSRIKEQISSTCAIGAQLWRLYLRQRRNKDTQTHFQVMTSSRASHVSLLNNTRPCEQHTKQKQVYFRSMKSNPLPPPEFLVPDRTFTTACFSSFKMIFFNTSLLPNLFGKCIHSSMLIPLKTCISSLLLEVFSESTVLN